MISKYKQLRIIIFYDLPMVETQEIKEYTRFRKTLHQLGFYQLQFSIYVKVVRTESGYKAVLNKLGSSIPPNGHIRIMKITEKQYDNMVILRGGENAHEIIVGDNEVVTFKGDDYE